MASELHGGKKQTCRAQAALKTLLPRDSLAVLTCLVDLHSLLAGDERFSADGHHHEGRSP